MGHLALAFALAATLPLSSGEVPTHSEIMTHGARLVDAPLEIPEPVYETDDTEINCPPPTRLRCWMAMDQDAGTGAPATVYCKCSK